MDKAAKQTKPKTGSKSQPAAPSPEFAAFEDLARKVIQTPKTEIDKREAKRTIRPKK